MRVIELLLAMGLNAPLALAFLRSREPTCPFRTAQKEPPLPPWNVLYIINIVFPKSAAVGRGIHTGTGYC